MSGMMDSSYGVRSMASSFGVDSSLVTDASPSAASSSSNDTEMQRNVTERPVTPQLAPVSYIDRLRSAASTPGSPASLSDAFEHLSDASRPGMLSQGISDAEDGAGQSGRASEHEHPHDSQLVMPTLLLRAINAPPAVARAPADSPALRLGTIGRADGLLDELFGTEHGLTPNTTEWAADILPAVAIQRLEAAFVQAQSVVRDDIPRTLHGTFMRVLAALPDLACFDALFLPLDIPPAGPSVELAAALHPFVNLVPIVRGGDDEAIALLEKQLLLQGISWLAPRDLDDTSKAAFYRLADLAETSPFKTTSPAAYPVLPLELLRQRSIELFLRWRTVDLAARSEDSVSSAREAAFAEQVAQRRLRLAEEEDRQSSADSGAAADDEDTGMSAVLPRPRHLRTRRKQCGPYEDPLSFGMGSVARVGLNAAMRMVRFGANILVVSVAATVIFGAGLGLGWAGSTGLAALFEAARQAWRSSASLF